MNSFLLFVAGLLVLALSALFAAPYFIDWNDYRDVFEAQATKLIGRSIDVGGDVSLTLLPAPVLKFETVNVADPKGSFDTPLASAQSVTVWLSVPPLLSGTIEARSIEVVQPVVNLRINKDGTGNWTDLGGEAASLAFIPKDVALNSVEIDNATVNIWRGKPEPDAVLEAVEGKLSSRGLQGPYRFNGQFSLAGKKRELRFSTGKPDPEGEFRLSVGVRSPETRDSFQFDGAVRGLQRVPIFKGTLKARLADPAGAVPSDEASGEKEKEAAPFEISANLFAGLTGADFEDFELTINRKAKPQSVRGLLTLDFDRGLVVKGSFSSRWVDIDSWYGDEKPENKRLGSALASLGTELLARSSSIREGNIRLLLDQVVLGGDLTTNFRSTINIADSQIQFTDLSARLPGDNRLKFSGKLGPGESGAGLEGTVLVRGDSLPRLLRWAGMTTDSRLVAQKDDFAIGGQLNASGSKFSLAGLEGNLFGSAFKGNLNYQTGERNVLSVKLESDKLDLARLLGAKASAPALVRLVSRQPDQEEANAGGGLGDWLSKTRTEADINVAAVTLAGLGETAVQMDVSLDRASVDIKQLKLNSGDDVAIQAGGRLTGLDSKPEGNVTFAVQANNGKGVVAIGSFLEMPALAGRSPERVAALTPIHLTAAVKSSPSKEAGGLDVQMEGAMGKSDVQLKMNMAGNLSDWREATVALSANVSNASGFELLQQLRPGLDDMPEDTFASGPGTLTLEANGVPKAGLSGKFALSASGTNVTLQGTHNVAEASGNFDGSVSFGAENTRAGLALFGIRLPAAFGGEPMQGSADFSWANSVYDLKGLKGEIGGTTLDADLTVDWSADKPRVAADVRSADASLARLFAPAIAWGNQQDDAQQIRGVTEPDAFWPKVPFNTNLMNAFGGSFSLQSKTMRIADRLQLSDASMTAELSDGRLSVTGLEGTVYGGKVRLSGTLEAQGNGAALEMKGSGSGFNLAEISATANGDPLIKAPADFEVSVRGEGLTPLGLVSGLSGTGQMTILDGDLNGFSLGAAHAAATAAQKEKSNGADEAALGKQVAEQLGASSMAFTQIKAPFSVNNGIVEFDKVALSDSEGRVIIATFLQLANMQLDSEWALQSATAIEGTKPRVSLVFSGPIADVGRMQPQIDTAGLARYVTIRQMQKDVERLEKLDVTGRTQQEKPEAPKEESPPPVAQNSAGNTPAPAPPPPPGPVPPLPERKQVDAKPEPKKPEPAKPDVAQSSEPPPVQPVIPGQDATPPPAPPTPAAPPVAAATAASPVAPEPSRKPDSPVPPAAADASTPAAGAPEPSRKPPQPAPAAAPATTVASAPAAEAPRSAAPLPVRKPPVPKVPVAAPRPAPPAPQAIQAAPPPLPWQQSTTPAPAANQATTGPQSPTQLPTPAATQDGAPAQSPPASRPRRFNPFTSGATVPE